MRCFSHVNLHSQAFGDARDFYLFQCGLGVSRVDGNADAAFLSSGFNHHEIEIFRDERSYVRHLGLEYDSPTDLQICLARLEQSGVTIERLSLVPGLMQSIFCRDPEGNGLHLFANLTTDWRAWQKGETAAAVTWASDPAHPPDCRRYPAGPLTVEYAKGAWRVARRFTGGGLAAAQPGRLRAFYADVLGCRTEGEALAGSLAGSQITIEAARAETAPGLAWISFTLEGIAGPETLRDPIGLTVHLRPA